MKKTYITTSIAYINAEPHIGFLLELVGADVLARYHRLKGEEVFFLTGTDEHGLKIQQAAESAAQAPQEFANRLTGLFEQVTKDFNISNNYFIRTSDPRHKKFVQEKWQELVAKGALEKRTYTGYYCVGCEAFKTDRELEDGKCTIHDRPVAKVEEENWFFKLSEYRQVILDWLNSGPVVRPESRLNEIRNIVLEIEDVSFSRPKEKLQWGVPVPGDDGQVMYVWAEALLNYLSGIELAGGKIDQVWPADYQIIGKDILKFHAAVWPAMLHVLGYDLPKQLIVHGFINVNGKKLSKTTGNIVTPNELLDRYGAEATRYLLLRQLSYYEDSNFVWEEFDAIYNGELANGIGNLAARVIGLAKKAELKIDIGSGSTPSGSANFEFADHLNQANAAIVEADKEITENKLWENGKDKTSHLQSAAALLLKAAGLLEPIIPETTQEIRRQLQELDSKPLFPRLENVAKP